jgi:hypothetical protein
MLRFMIACTLFAATISGAAVPDERLVTIEPDDNVPFNSEMVVTISGWPTDCPSVELAYLDGSVGDPGSGEVVGSWGIFELSGGAAQVTVPTPPEPEEYNLRVEGTVPECGEPYFSPDFFVLGSGDIDINDVDYGSDKVNFLASNWSPNCPTLDVTWRGPWAEEGLFEEDNVKIPGTEPMDWEWGEIALTDGSGWAEGPLPSVPERLTFWEITVTGDPDQCGGSWRTQFDFREPPEPPDPPITVITAPGASIESVSVSSSCDDDDGIFNVTIHEPENLGRWGIAFASEEIYFQQFVDVTEPTSVVYSFGPIPNDDYVVVVDEPSGDEEFFSVTVACPAAAETSAPSSATVTPSSSPEPSTPITLPGTGSTGRTDSALIVAGLLFVASGSVLLVARRR